MTEDEDAHLEARAAEKARAIDGVDAAMTLIARRDGEPDHWQRVFLAQAIAMIFSGLYSVARADVALAMTPQRDRSAMPMLPLDPMYERLDLVALRNALREAENEPVMRYPHFGPIRFTSEER